MEFWILASLYSRRTRQVYGVLCLEIGKLSWETDCNMMNKWSKQQRQGVSTLGSGIASGCTEARNAEVEWWDDWLKWITVEHFCHYQLVRLHLSASELKATSEESIFFFLLLILNILDSKLTDFFKLCLSMNAINITIIKSCKKVISSYGTLYFELSIAN